MLIAVQVRRALTTRKANPNLTVTLPLNDDDMAICNKYLLACIDVDKDPEAYQAIKAQLITKLNQIDAARAEFRACLNNVPYPGEKSKANGIAAHIDATRNAKTTFNSVVVPYFKFWVTDANRTIVDNYIIKRSNELQARLLDTIGDADKLFKQTVINSVNQLFAYRSERRERSPAFTTASSPDHIAFLKVNQEEIDLLEQVNSYVKRMRSSTPADEEEDEEDTQ